jgi:hypothetical protein
MLRPQDYDLWLAHAPVERSAPPTPQLELLALLRPFPAEQMTANKATMEQPCADSECPNPS